jgi:CHAD domain-containing protein
VKGKGAEPKDVEIEWQLDALDLRPVERWLAALPGRPAYATPAGVPGEVASAMTAHPRPAERLVDTYLDTVDWRIGRSGFVVRIRHRGGRGEVTLKDMAQATGGLRRRLEVTEPLPPGGVGALGTDGPVGWRLRALAGKRPLETVLEVRTRRRPYDLRVSEERVAEVALDDTTIVVADDHQPVRLQRVEVEVEPAWVEGLTPMVDTLRRECGLQPAALSKFEAGLLAAGLRIPPPPDLGPTALGEDPSVGDVAFAVLRRNLATMLAHEAGTRLGEDAEELHDMRVATRRMRAALSLFSDSLPVRARHVRTELGWLADALGTVRDLDVQLERLDGWLDDVADEDRGALSDLATLLGNERADARRELLLCLDSARYERLVASFTTMLRQGPSRRSAAARAPAVAVVPELVDGLHRSATKAARRARRSGDPADYHRTRIRGKRLRYGLEFVSEIYGGRTARYVRHVVRLQDALGLMQDARVAAARLHELATAEGSGLSPTTVFVMGGVAERYRHESDRLAAKVPGLLHELGGATWRKLVALMAERRVERGALYGWPPPTHPVGRPGARPDVSAAPVRTTPGPPAAPASVHRAAVPPTPVPPAPVPPTAVPPASVPPAVVPPAPVSPSAVPTPSTPPAPAPAGGTPAPPAAHEPAPHPSSWSTRPRSPRPGAAVQPSTNGEGPRTERP